jgi:hypothetical protein
MMQERSLANNDWSKRCGGIAGYARNRYWRQLLRKFGGSTLTNSKTTSR